MKTSLMMNFSVDKENKKISVEREFAAPVSKVWAAWTQSHLLDQWWAPKPYKTKTKTMDFREGGHWLYAMVGPEGDTHWCRADYKAVKLEQSFSALDAFCDEQGNINYDFPRSSWTNEFRAENASSTIVTIEIKYDKLEDLEKIVQMGFREGFTAAMENLDEIVENGL